MERLINFINRNLTYARKYPAEAKIYYYQAFGALQFYLEGSCFDGMEYHTIDFMWSNTFRPAFEAIIYGGVA